MFTTTTLSSHHPQPSHHHHLGCDEIVIFRIKNVIESKLKKNERKCYLSFRLSCLQPQFSPATATKQSYHATAITTYKMAATTSTIEHNSHNSMLRKLSNRITTTTATILSHHAIVMTNMIFLHLSCLLFIIYMHHNKRTRLNRVAWLLFIFIELNCVGQKEDKGVCSWEEKGKGKMQKLNFI